MTADKQATARNLGPVTYKFQKLEIYQLAQKLPRSEDFNLKSQLTRAATSIALNIAEGSTSQSDAEQSRFLGMALRSSIETVACQDIILRRRYVKVEDLQEARELGAKLFAKIQAMRRALGQSVAPGARSFVSGRRS
ncbi:MAG TPA: four helix bundle protein [Pyrinomonadaceae bacterium]|nr:four helix bundle protein [Pyrinomonadaceae bacterium]